MTSVVDNMLPVGFWASTPRDIRDDLVIERSSRKWERNCRGSTWDKLRAGRVACTEEVLASSAQPDWQRHQSAHTTDPCASPSKPETSGCQIAIEDNGLGMGSRKRPHGLRAISYRGRWTAKLPGPWLGLSPRDRTPPSPGRNLQL